MKNRIYVASSWRNRYQPEVVEALRALGHEVYDFRHPAPGNEGFSWSEIDPEWKAWTPDAYRRALQHPIAERGYGYDIGALRACDACVLVLPSGRSASWEFGYAMGQGKRGVVFMPEAVEPELMYREAEIATDLDELLRMFHRAEALAASHSREQAERAVRMLVEFAYEQGFHEMGFDPVAELVGAVARDERTRLLESLGEELIGAGCDCGADPDEEHTCLAGRVETALREP